MAMASTKGPATAVSLFDAGGRLRFRDAQDDRYCYVRTKVNDKKTTTRKSDVVDIQVSGHVAILVVSSLHVWEGDQLKPMTAEVLQTIRDQSALLFRCLYNISGEKKALDLATHFFFE
ncbi:hypothetical protein GQ600_19389 [Phytophthora cactorum]|nr:hypothetical protein GQ600_19389 [Phytophthora cactorum]